MSVVLRPQIVAACLVLAASPLTAAVTGVAHGRVA